jgi:hypothetical protein
MIGQCQEQLMTTLDPQAVTRQPARAVTDAGAGPRRCETFLIGLRQPLTEARPWPDDPLRPRRLRDLAREQHRFLQRTARYLAGERVRQYLAAGIAGSSSSRMLRSAVQQIHPWARVAVLPTPADLSRVALRDGLDLTRPMGLYLTGTLHHILDDTVAAALVQRLAGAVAPGSYLVVSHLSGDHPSSALDAAVRACQRTGWPVRLRSRAGVRGLLDGLTLVEPGVDLLPAWHRDGGEPPPPATRTPCWGAVGRVP